MFELLPNDWKNALKEELEKPYISDLDKYISEEYENAIVYPPKEMVFNAFNRTPFGKVKCVILGQDPYHNPGEAMGLCFSVPEGVKIPPSLVNMYKELNTDIGMDIPKHGDLSSWADQGVLLLNAVLTVRKNEPACYAGKGWEDFTDSVLKALDKSGQPICYVLWGGYARKKAKLIKNPNSFVLEGPHPSPLSSYRGFFGCKHFSKANEYLISKGIEPINWDNNL